MDWNRIVHTLVRPATKLVRSLFDKEPPAPARARPRTMPPKRSSSRSPHSEVRHVLPDFVGDFHIEYAPAPDGAPDPGEVVWTWVPFEDDPSRGKDRPVLLLGWHGKNLLALMLTSKDHDRDAAEEARHGRHWFDLGAGPWDPKGRPSEVRLDRVLRIDPASVRRFGAILDKTRFDFVVAAMRKYR